MTSKQQPKLIQRKVFTVSFIINQQIIKKKLRCYGTPRERALFTSEGDDNESLNIFFNTLGEGHSFKTLFDTYMRTFYPGEDQ